MENVKAWFAGIWLKMKDGFRWLINKIKGVFGKKEDANSKEKKANKKIAGEKENSLFKMICLWIFRLRSVFLAIPVVYAAIVLAVENAAKLPAKLLLYVPVSQQALLTSKAIEFSRDTAVYFPLTVTGLCLVFMFCSRRTVYPWLISIFTLVLPVFFRFISVFPG